MKITSYRNSMIITFFIIVIVAIIMTNKYLIKKEKEFLSKKYISISHNIQDKIDSIIYQKENATLALSIVLSSNNNIVNILKNKNKQNIELNKLSLKLREETVFKNVWFQVIDKEGVSLYRSWTNKKNDKLYKVRKDIIEMIKNPKVQKSISIGIYDMTFKAMVPIFEEGKFIGIIETITHFNSITRGMRENDNIEPIIILEKKFTEQLRENSFSKVFIQDHYIANLSVDNKILDYFNNKDISKFLSYDDYIISDKYLIINTPIIHNNMKLATFLSFLDLNEINIEYIEEYKQNTFLYLALFLILLALVLFVFSYYLYSNELKRLYNKLNQKQEELHNLNTSLKKTINDEILKNNIKNRVLFHQTKMAAMGEMIGNIAHQWRQPLSLITSLASGIKLKNELGVLNSLEEKDSLNKIIETANYLSNTVDDFRYFFSPNKEKTRVNTKELFQKVFNLLDSEFRTKNIQIIKNIEEIYSYTYENELIQVMINIINNAKDELLKNENYEYRYILIDLYKEDQNIIIKIKDNAGGISESIIDRIFEPYFTTKHRSQGTGIGLYMSEEIIVKHLKGDILVSNVESIIEGKSFIGAEFIVSIAIETES